MVILIAFSQAVEFADNRHALARPMTPTGRLALNPDLLPANNPALRPPVAGKVGLWSKTDSTSYFKDFIVSPQK